MGSYHLRSVYQKQDVTPYLHKVLNTTKMFTSGKMFTMVKMFTIIKMFTMIKMFSMIKMVYHDPRYIRPPKCLP